MDSSSQMPAASCQARRSSKIHFVKIRNYELLITSSITSDLETAIKGKGRHPGEAGPV
jgi:hypothetical protein